MSSADPPPGPRPATSSGFRPDIQGLRAIAVLTVIVSHAGLALPGGYVGVDVFFVISGFLISSLLFREVTRSGTVSILGFYGRRARRILPAATVTTIATLIASCVLIPLTQTREVVVDAIWASFFAANIRFAQVGTDYFAAEQPPSPLQHYWSLAVEEQFYLVWPLLLLICLALTRGSRGGGLPRRAVGLVLLVITLASLGWSLIHTAGDPTSAYFNTPARAYELSIGALAALVSDRIGAVITDRARWLLGGGGLVAIAIACLAFSEATPFPGAAALLPVLGSAAVLLAGAGAGARPPLPVRALGTAPMRLIGDWSYSLYLWHWPVLTLWAEHQGHDLSALQAVLGIALTFALAWASYRFVETPLRVGRLPGHRILVLYPVTVALVLATCFGANSWARYRTGEFGDDPAISFANFDGAGSDRSSLARDDRRAMVQASVIAAERDMAIPSTLDPPLLDIADAVVDLSPCNYAVDGTRELCPRGDTEADRSWVVIGDSHARALAPAVDAVAEEAGYTTYHFVKPQCTAALITPANGKFHEPFADCVDFHEWMLDQIEQLQPELVLITSTSPTPANGVFVDGERITDERGVDEELARGRTELFDAVRERAGRVVWMDDVPIAPFEPANCLSTPGNTLGDCLFTPLPWAEKRAKRSTAVARAAGLEVISLDRWLCWRHACPAVVGHTITYRDNDHITPQRASQLAVPLARELGLTR